MSRTETITIALDTREYFAVVKHQQPNEALSVTARRLLLSGAGTEPSQGRPRWLTDDILDRMGFDSDTSLAAEVGVSRGTIARWRKRVVRQQTSAEPGMREV